MSISQQRRQQTPGILALALSTAQDLTSPLPGFGEDLSDGTRKSLHDTQDPRGWPWQPLESTSEAGDGPAFTGQGVLSLHSASYESVGMAVQVGPVRILAGSYRLKAAADPDQPVSMDAPIPRA